MSSRCLGGDRDDVLRVGTLPARRCRRSCKRDTKHPTPIVHQRLVPIITRIMSSSATPKPGEAVRCCLYRRRTSMNDRAVSLVLARLAVEVDEAISFIKLDELFVRLYRREPAISARSLYKHRACEQVQERLVHVVSGSSKEANISKPTEENSIPYDHTWHNPIALSDSEWQLILAYLSDLGIPSKGWMRVSGGRSGADLVRVETERGQALLVRATSSWRAANEMAVLRKHTRATHLVVPGFHHPLALSKKVLRPYPVAITVTKWIDGVSLTSPHEACDRFCSIFVDPSENTNASDRRDAWHQVILRAGLSVDQEEAYAHLSQPWHLHLLHGDPSMSNIIRTQGRDLHAVDFANGGWGFIEMEWARWQNSIARIREGRQLCDCCLAYPADSFAMYLDCLRRARSDAADSQRRNFWLTRAQTALDSH